MDKRLRRYALSCLVLPIADQLEALGPADLFQEIERSLREGGLVVASGATLTGKVGPVDLTLMSCRTLVLDEDCGDLRQVSVRSGAFWAVRQRATVARSSRRFVVRITKLPHRAPLAAPSSKIVW
jgi:hypothetical protein